MLGDFKAILIGIAKSAYESLHVVQLLSGVHTFGGTL